MNGKNFIRNIKVNKTSPTAEEELNLRNATWERRHANSEQLTQCSRVLTFLNTANLKLPH